MDCCFQVCTREVSHILLYYLVLNYIMGYCSSVGSVFGSICVVLHESGVVCCGLLNIDIVVYYDYDYTMCMYLFIYIPIYIPI